MIQTQANQQAQSDSVFGLKLDFDPTRSRPSDMFLALSHLTKALQSVDETLVKTFHVEVQPLSLIEDVEKGSILVWIKNILESADDEALASLELRKMIGAYLVKAKYVLIDFIDKRTEITSIDEVEILKAELVEEAKNTEISALSIYQPINTVDVLTDIKQIRDALAEFSESEQVSYYISPSKNILFNKAFNISPENIEDIAIKEKLKSTLDMILKIKKPDYLGSSKWEFRHKSKKFEANIVDEAWLAAFQRKEVILGPGDALKVKVDIETSYDNNGEVVSSQYVITKVFDVITPPSADQKNLLTDESENDEFSLP